MARFKKGEVQNKLGRRRGSKNNIQPEVRKRLTEFLSDGIETLITDFSSSKSTLWYRLHVLTFVAGFVLAKESELLKMELTESQILQIIEHIKTNGTK